MRTLQSICVFCGASPGNQPVYQEVAAALGRLLAQRGLRLVYGGGSIGLMGALAKAVHAEGGEILSIIPHSLVPKEIAGVSLGQLMLCDTMLERKELMGQHADAFIVLPGGYGTLDELFEMVTWTQLGIHSKPLGLLNINGYFDGLIQFLDHMASAGFVRPKHRELVLVDTDATLLLDRLAAQELPESIVQWQKK
ncbi:MAG: TIGR00730 family Rossman fold protein [Caldilineaceae bacterium]|nr:TIGR00730 family Rossman fold protein [Caldilineaceae bacterium]